MINPAHLDLFRAVLRHGGMTRAAAALGVGQPHVSRAVAQLEAELGFPLFERGHGSALATPEGRAFAREVDRTLAGLDQLRRVAREIRELGTGPLRIACQPSLAARFVPKAIARLAAESPSARATLLVPSPDTIWSWAASGQCDIGLVRPRASVAGVVVESFLAVDAVCALPMGHALAGKREIGIDDLAAEPLIAGAAGVFQEAIERVFAQAGHTPRFVHMAQYTAARCGLVAEGLGIAIVDPLPARALGLPLELRAFRPRLPIETMLIRAAASSPGRLADRFVALLRAERDALLSEAPEPRRSPPPRRRAARDPAAATNGGRRP